MRKYAAEQSRAEQRSGRVQDVRHTGPKAVGVCRRRTGLRSAVWTPGARSEWHGGIVWRVIATCRMAMCEVCVVWLLVDSAGGERDSGFQPLAGRLWARGGLRMA